MAEPDFRWTQDSWGPDDPTDAHRPRSSQRERLAWLGVLVLAIVAFEITADPAFSTALGCLKFGWEEWRTSWWLGRTDPDRLRGRICSRFYLAWGLWRVSLVASAMMFLIAIGYGVVEKELLGKPRALVGPPPGFVTAALLAFLGFGLSALVSSFAAFSAFRHRVAVWVGPEARWSREEKSWPPHRVAPRRATSNRTKVIVLSGLITSTIVGLFGLIVVIGGLMEPGARQAFAEGLGVALVILSMISMIGVPFLLLVLAEIVGSRVYAATPEACWGDGSRLPG